jgi:NTP pyrophosphatase (non-canonical NTP hydrolase)
MTFTDRVERWATDRNLIDGATPRDQFLKLVEEVGELSRGIQKCDRAQIADAIGDCAVVLAILAAQYELGFDHCCDVAWNQIKDRKGKMVNGVFVKDDK